MYKLYLGGFHMATFNRLGHLDDYVHYLVQSLSNNYTFDSFKVVEVKKRMFRKPIETVLQFKDIDYMLENGLAK